MTNRLNRNKIFRYLYRQDIFIKTHDLDFTDFDDPTEDIDELKRQASLYKDNKNAPQE